MTDRVRTLTVVLERDTRVDDAEETIRAISMIRGVASVEKGAAVSSGDYSARMIVRSELRERLAKVVDDIVYPGKSGMTP